MQLRVPREKGIRYLGFAAGIPGGRDGRCGGGGEGSQRSGMKDHGSGYIFGEWWIRGACMDTAVCFELSAADQVCWTRTYVWWDCPFAELEGFGRC
jgi:hypothetical protein